MATERTYRRIGVLALTAILVAATAFVGGAAATTTDLGHGVVANGEEPPAPTNATSGDYERRSKHEPADKEAYADELHAEDDTTLRSGILGQGADDRQSGSGDFGTLSSVGDDQDDIDDGGYICDCEASETKTQDVLDSYIEGHTHFELDEAGGYYVVDGHSEGWWMGFDPLNAEKAVIGTAITVNGIEPSIGLPPSGEFFLTSRNVAEYEGVWYDDWDPAHFYWGLEGDAWGGVTSIEQSDGFTFRLEGTDYTIYTHIKK